VQGSNLRRLSRRFYSPSLLPETNAGDQRIRRPRQGAGPTPSAMRPWASVSRGRAATDGGIHGHGRRGWERLSRPSAQLLASDLVLQDAYSLSSPLTGHAKCGGAKHVGVRRPRSALCMVHGLKCPGSSVCRSEAFTKILSSARAASGVSSGGSAGSYARDADYYQILASTRALTRGRPWRADCCAGLAVACSAAASAGAGCLARAGAGRPCGRC
jgi:hypothetical protein